MIRYAEQGREPKYGLRLDIDKRVFIDHLTNDAHEHIFHLAAPKIATVLGVELRAMRYMNFSKETISSSTAPDNTLREGVVEVIETSEVPVV